MLKAGIFFGIMLAILATVSAQSCGGSEEGSGGSFESPNFPSNYPNNAGCQWYFTANAGERVVIRFSELITAPGDTVTIRDGHAELSPLIVTLGGQSYTNLVFETTGEKAYVLFKADATGTARGFSGTWESYNGPTITTPSTPPPPTTPGPTNCGGNFTGVSGSIISNGYPFGYPDNSRCIWRITSENSKVLGFVIHDLETEDGYDQVVFRDGLTLTGNVFFTAEGSIRGVAIRAAGSTATVVFTSDSSISASGFNISWTETNLKSSEKVVPYKLH